MPILVGTSPSALEEFPLDLPTQAYIGNSGIVFGDRVEDDYGCRWSWSPTNTWGAKPAPREQVGDRGYDHGQWDATRYYGPRMLAIPGTVRAPDHASLHAAEQRLRNAISITEFMLRITEPGFDSYAMVRQQGELNWTEDGTPSSPHATFSIGLYARDPRIWSMLERSFLDLAFPTSSGGLVWPVTWPATWTGVVTSGSRLLLNPGTEPVGLDLRIDGPAHTVTIVFPEIGETLSLANPDGDVLAAGQWLQIDTTNHLVLLNGEAGRRSWAYGDWLVLPPGVETAIAIAGTGTTTASKVSGTYRAARI